MDPKLAICVFTVILAVDARSYLRPQCREFCPYGRIPGRSCECYWPKNGKGGYIPKPSNCDLKYCAPRSRCVERYGRPICVSTYPTYPGTGAPTCSLPKQSGPCEAAIPRFYFNAHFQSCERFIYGGCGGNSNNFVSIQECRDTCESRQGHTGLTRYLV